METLLFYGADAAISYFTNSYWYKGVGDMMPCDPTNTGFIDRWNRQKQSKEIEMYGRIHSDICNVPKLLLPGIKLQIKFTKAKPSFYLMNPAADWLLLNSRRQTVRRIRANPRIPLAHEETLKTDLTRCNMTRVELKTFTFSAGPLSLSIDQAVMGRIPKRLLFTMIANDFLGTINTNPYKFQHFGLRSFAMYVNGRQIPSESLSIDPGHETTVMGYKTIWKLRHSPFELGTTDNSRLIWPHQKDILYQWNVAIYVLS